MSNLILLLLPHFTALCVHPGLGGGWSWAGWSTAALQRGAAAAEEE